MAQRVVTLVTCDLDDDDTPAERTVTFAFDGASYEMDVCAEHAAGMDETFAPFVGAARRTGGRSRRGSGGGGGGGRREASANGGRGGDRDRTQAIRAWAQQQGVSVSSRGRIPANVVEQYERAHA